MFERWSFFMIARKGFAGKVATDDWKVGRPGAILLYKPTAFVT